MKLLSQSYLLLLFMALFSSCSQTESDGEMLFGKPVSQIDSAEAEQTIREVLGVLKPGEVFVHENAALYSTSILTDLYIKNDFKGIWTRQEYIEDVKFLIDESGTVGLFPTDYHLKEINALIDTLTNGATLDPRYAAYLDLMLSDAIMMLYFHYYNGKISPYVLNQNWNFSQGKVPQNISELLIERINNRQLADDFEEVLPDRIFLKEMEANLANYRRFKANGGWKSIPYLDGKIKPGQRHELMPKIYERLLISEDIAPLDSAADPGVYDTVHVDAIKNYQYRHQMAETGIIDQELIDKLNISVDDKIKKIMVNLERARWVDFNPKENVIFVNIAGYNMAVLQDSVVKAGRKVMTGKPYHSTPIFQSDLAYIEFNPTWTIPRSILQNETIPRIKRDPGYLSRNNMELLTFSGDVVDLKSINFANYSPENFPFMVRQKPGKYNALGEVKFIFPNQYAVYLHDTPSKYLFAKTKRAFSHGCIRVEDPLDLARILLDDEEKWSKEKINEVVQSREITRAVPKTKYKVMLFYLTCTVDLEGNMIFLDDVYNRDEKVWVNLSKPMDINLANLPSDFKGLELDSMNTEMSVL